MTPEKLIERLNGLRARADEALALAHSLNGAIQEAEFWLVEVRKVTEEKDDDRDPAQP